MPHFFTVKYVYMYTKNVYASTHMYVHDYKYALGMQRGRFWAFLKFRISARLSPPLSCSANVKKENCKQRHKKAVEIDSNDKFNKGKRNERESHSDLLGMQKICADIQTHTYIRFVQFSIFVCFVYMYSYRMYPNIKNIHAKYTYMYWCCHFAA